MATNGRRRTKGAGSIIHRKDGSWEFRREVGRDPATGKRRYVSAKGRTCLSSNKSACRHQLI